jgi:hypothetical protein
MECDKCKTEMVAITKKNSISLLGIIGSVIFVVGALIAFSNFIIGLVLMVFGIFTGMAFRGEKLIMTCPRCGHKAKPVAL